MAEESDDRGFQPPYNIPWNTFLSTVERAANDLPNKIDRSYLSSAAGNIQTYLIAAFKGFELVDEELRPTGLKAFAESPEGRPQLVANMLRERYGPIIELGQTKATAGELEHAFDAQFPKITGESRKKAIRFFLAAAAYAGIQLSSLWKAPKASPTGRKPRRSRAATGAPASPPPAAPSDSIKPAGKEIVADFGDAGSVTMYVAIDWLKLPDDVFAALRTTIFEVERLGNTTSATGTPGADSRDAKEAES